MSFLLVLYLFLYSLKLLRFGNNLRLHLGFRSPNGTSVLVHEQFRVAGERLSTVSFEDLAPMIKSVRDDRARWSSALIHYNAGHRKEGCRERGSVHVMKIFGGIARSGVKRETFGNNRQSSRFDVDAGTCSYCYELLHALKDTSWRYLLTGRFGPAELLRLIRGC